MADACYAQTQMDPCTSTHTLFFLSHAPTIPLPLLLSVLLTTPCQALKLDLPVAW